MSEKRVAHELTTNKQREAYQAMFLVWRGVLQGEVTFDPFEVTKVMAEQRGISPSKGFDMSWSAYQDAIEIHELTGYIGKHSKVDN